MYPHDLIIRLILCFGVAICEADALAQGRSSDIATCILALSDKNPETRWTSAVALAKMGVEAVPSLVKALGSVNEIVRAGAALALGKIGSEAKAAVPGLIAALKDPSEPVREIAAEALGEIGPGAGQAIEPLLDCFSDPDPFVNGKSAEALSKIGPDAIPGLIRSINSPGVTTRWCATIALGKLGPAAYPAVPTLTQSLKDDNANVRWGSAVALGNIGIRAEGAVPGLLEALSDRDEDVRWGASLSLDKIDPIAVESHTDWQSIATLIDSLAPRLMHDSSVPGVAIALVSDRRLVWSGCYGVKNAKSGEKVSRQTLFEACSMSKPVFTYAVLKLVELGKLDLDRPLAQYLDLSSLRGQPFPGSITARMVLSHTTGLPNWRKDEEERDGPLPVRFKPGSRFGYSGEGMYYLQQVVEQITGEPLDLYTSQTLLKPMGLTHMSYVWTEGLDSMIAGGHDSAGTFLMKTRYTHPNAAYTLYTSADDYAEFLIEIMKPDRSAKHSLSERSIDTMLTPQILVDSRDPIERPGKARGSAAYWGLGWSINATPMGDIIHHSGANRSGFRCFSQFNRAKGSGIVIMTNSTGGGDFWVRIISRIGNF